MEYIVIVIASILAGVGTGLVGLSAATVMVPLLVVLCPTFQGEHGAFMAIAIALASDVLGSGVTTLTYAKNKKIDLKHGWIMVACVIGMCAVGSVVAFFVRQQVMGAFSLILCVAIGIRFLLKPESSHKEDIPSEQKLSPFQIAISLFFGLTIGFGTGFFGSGGGMMMLIIFTAFLHYERKTAVGTSTFIMTFTALIASVTHILMEPSIVLECWPFLLIGIGVSTLFSLLSARFANKVDGKITGYVTGGLLFVLGIVLVLFHYHEYFDPAYVEEFLFLAFWVVVPLVLVATSLIIIRKLSRLPDYIFRKLLHNVAICIIIPMVVLAKTWWIPCILIGALLVLIFLFLKIFEPFPFYKKLFVEKGQHEVLVSFVILFLLLAAVIALFWGLRGDEYKYLAIVTVMAWGPGDAMAAIIGINFGRHKLSGRMIEGTKSVEGCIAMALTSFAFVTGLLFIFASQPWWLILIQGVLIGAVSSIVELYTKKGFDTITCPLAAGLLLFLFSLI